MSDVRPDPGEYDDALDRVAELLRKNREELLEIERISADSFRLWLDKLVQQVSESLGIAAATVRAFVDDVWAILGNAKSKFKASYREAYEKSRQINRS
jgi:hypothetical protein